MKKEKEFVVFYKSMEHYEILGFVKANSIKGAEEKALKELNIEAIKYSVKEAMIAEISECKEIIFR